MRTATLSLAAAALAFCAVSVRAEPLADAAIPAQNNDHSTSYSSNSYGISDWQTCHPGKDSCSNSNAKCCIAKDDKYSGKYTCRPHGKDCDDYSYSSSYGDSSYGSDYNDNYNNDYYNDNSNDYSDGYSDDYSSNYYGARAKGGRARPSAGRPQSPAHRGLMHSKAYSDDYYGVSDWKTCHPSSDKCSNPSSKCCVAKDDKHSGKYTCRPAGKDCDGYSYGSSYGSDYSSDNNDYSGSNDYSDYNDYNDYNDYSGSDDYNDYSYSSDYYGARARHSGARARPHARPQGNNHVDVCEVTYKTYVGNCNAAYAQTHKKEEHEKCLDGAKAWKEICEAQSGYY